MAFTKQIKAFQHGERIVLVRQDPATGEYRARLTVYGIAVPKADYFTDDLPDALGTAQHMVKARLPITTPTTSNIATLVANLYHAVRNRETVTIGGGVFGPDELREAADTLQKTIDEGESKWT